MGWGERSEAREMFSRHDYIFITLLKERLIKDEDPNIKLGLGHVELKVLTRYSGEWK